MFAGSSRVTSELLRNPWPLCSMSVRAYPGVLRHAVRRSSIPGCTMPSAPNGASVSFARQASSPASRATKIAAFTRIRIRRWRIRIVSLIEGPNEVSYSCRRPSGLMVFAQQAVARAAGRRVRCP